MGIAAIPFLVMWGFTGAHFELKQVSELWYAVLPGEQAEEPVVVSKPLSGKSVTMNEAAAIAGRTVPDGRLVSVSVPDRATKDSTYFSYLVRGNDTWTTASTRGTSASPSIATAGRQGYAFLPLVLPIAAVVWLRPAAAPAGRDRGRERPPRDRTGTGGG